MNLYFDVLMPMYFLDGFSTKGKIKEVDAQTILNAIGVGFIPSSRLEIQILALYEKLQIDYQAGADCPLLLKTEEPEKTTKLQEIIAKLAADDNKTEAINRLNKALNILKTGS